MQAGAVVQQIRLGEVAAHAMPQQDDRHAGMVLTDVLVEAGEIADHLAPAVVVGEMPQGPVFGSFAMSTQVRGIHTVALLTAFFRQAGVAGTVFRHAVGQQDHGFQRRDGQPLVDEESTVVTRGQPESVVDHGDSFA